MHMGYHHAIRQFLVFETRPWTGTMQRLCTSARFGSLEICTWRLNGRISCVCSDMGQELNHWMGKMMNRWILWAWFLDNPIWSEICFSEGLCMRANDFFLMYFGPSDVPCSFLATVWYANCHLATAMKCHDMSWWCRYHVWRPECQCQAGLRLLAWCGSYHWLEIDWIPWDSITQIAPIYGLWQCPS